MPAAAAQVPTDDESVADDESESCCSCSGSERTESESSALFKLVNPKVQNTGLDYAWLI